MLDGDNFYDIFVAGARNIIKNEQWLNRINVFPVPDGDTGTNLALTMRGIVRSARREKSAQLTLNSIAVAAMDNSYGNSGLIFARYFSGIADEVGDLGSVSYQKFIAAAQHAALVAKQAVSTPQDGTILTVMQAWANSLACRSNIDFGQAVVSSLEELEKAVAKTQFQLKELRQNSVVDAGAKAFYFFVEGMAHFFRHGAGIAEDEGSFEILELPEIHPSTDVGANKYCAQFLLRTTVAPEYYLGMLAEFGDSIVVNARKDQVQVHLHTANPAAVMSRLVGEAQVISHKVEDMQLKANLKFKSRGRLAIVTDSIADVPKDILAKEDVVVIALNLVIDSVVYLDKLTMQPSQFYKQLDSVKLSPTSAQASIATTERILGEVLESTDEVIVLCVSAGMSGMYSRISKIAERLTNSTKKIAVINTKANSVAQGLLIVKAIEWRAAGLSLAEIVQNLEAAVARTKVYVSVKTLRYMLRGGRVPKFRSWVLSLLDLKPVVSIDKDGKGAIFKKSLSTASAKKAILRQLAYDKKHSGIDVYALVYADDPAHLQEFARECEMEIGKPPLYTEAISPIVGLSAGRGAIAIGYIRGEA